LYSVPLTSLDPAQAYQPGTTALTNDGLTAVGGSDGAQVVPDLATSLQAPTDGGTTYTFQVRREIRYSNGAPVRPDDFRRAIERDFKLGDAVAITYHRDLVRGATCVARPLRCNLSRGIVADDAAGRVTFHLVAPDPELLYRLAVWDAVAVPPGTPNHDVRLHPIPATGAYEVASATLRQVRYVRNPFFHQWSAAARPDGYPDQIILKLGASPSAELTAVERGTADYTVDGPPTNRLTEVETRFAGQLHPTPNDVLDQLALNTRVAPFNDIRVRRALNYAVDRGRVAKLVGSAAQPTCQFLPPYIGGLRALLPVHA
jgi:peptide/nickel transport system substrate-binding protein